MIKWILDNWQSILLGIVAVSSIIVRFTKNKTDNKVLESFLNILEKMSIFNTDKQRKILEAAKTVIDTEEKTTN